MTDKPRKPRLPKAKLFRMVSTMLLNERTGPISGALHSAKHTLYDGPPNDGPVRPEEVRGALGAVLREVETRQRALAELAKELRTALALVKP